MKMLRLLAIFLATATSGCSLLLISAAIQNRKATSVDDYCLGPASLAESVAKNIRDAMGLPMENAWVKVKHDYTTYLCDQPREAQAMRWTVEFVYANPGLTPKEMGMVVGGKCVEMRKNDTWFAAAERAGPVGECVRQKKEMSWFK